MRRGAGFAVDSFDKMEIPVLSMLAKAGFVPIAL